MPARVDAKENPRLLVMGKDRDLVDLLSLVLTRAGFATCAAYGNASGFKALECKSIEVVVVDLSATRHGVDLLRSVRDRCHLPLIALAEQDDQSPMGQTLHDLGVEYLYKPLSPRALAERVAAYLTPAVGHSPAGPEREPATPAKRPTEYLPPRRRPAERQTPLRRAKPFQFGAYVPLKTTDRAGTFTGRQTGQG